MTIRRYPQELVDDLRDLGAALDTGEAPDVRAAVRARLSAGPTPRRLRRFRPAPPQALWSAGWRAMWRAMWGVVWRGRRRRVVALAVVAAVVAGVAATPPARAAVGRVLRFAGVDVVPATPGRPVPTSPAPLPTDTVALAQARAAALFPIGVPARLGPPERVQLLDVDRGHPRVVSLFWRGGTVRLDEFDGELDLMYIKQEQPPGFQWEQLSSGYGLWLPGPHPVTYVDRTGTERTDAARMAGPTLIWTRDAVTYRLEGVPDEPTARAVAESVG